MRVSFLEQWPRLPGSLAERPRVTVAACPAITGPFMTGRKIAGLRCYSACASVRYVSLALPEGRCGDTCYEGTPRVAGTPGAGAEVDPSDPGMFTRFLTTRRSRRRSYLGVAIWTAGRCSSDRSERRLTQADGVGTGRDGQERASYRCRRGRLRIALGSTLTGSDKEVDGPIRSST